MAIPSFDELFNPVLKALRQLGGSASVSEIEETVISILKLTEEDIAEIHRGSTTKLSYRLAWARNYLKRYGLLENSSRGVWSLTTKGKEVTQVNKKEVEKEVRALDKKVESVEEKVAEGREPDEESVTWQEKLLEQMMKLSSDAFERLCQRILRESGFVQVEVTGKSGDGGIDGKGIVKMGGLISFHVIFQCKRFSGSVSSQQVRDFRGAKEGRADKGLLITTGTYTREAKKEATRDGATPIDLIDGDQLVEKMKELELGITIKQEEVVEINEEWFQSF